MAILYKTDGTQEEKQPKNGRDFQLEELQEMVGGYIEIVPCWHPQHKDKVIVLNEEGKLEGMPLNKKATEIYNVATDVIVGNALICLDKEIR